MRWRSGKVLTTIEKVAQALKDSIVLYCSYSLLPIVDLNADTLYFIALEELD